MSLVELNLAEAIGDSVNGAGTRDAAAGHDSGPTAVKPSVVGCRGVMPDNRSGGDTPNHATAPAVFADTAGDGDGKNGGAAPAVGTVRVGVAAGQDATGDAPARTAREPGSPARKSGLLRGQSGPLPKEPINVDIDGIEYEIDPTRPYGERGPVTLITEHRRIMHMLLAGYPRRQIAAESGRTLANINLIVRSPLFASELRKLEKQIEAGLTDVSKRFRANAPQAHNALLDMIVAEGAPKHSPVRLGAAKAYLKFGGFDPVKRTEHTEVIEKRHVISVQEAWRRRRALITGELGEAGGSSDGGSAATNRSDRAIGESTVGVDGAAVASATGIASSGRDALPVTAAVATTADSPAAILPHRWERRASVCDVQVPAAPSAAMLPSVFPDTPEFEDDDEHVDDVLDVGRFAGDAPNAGDVLDDEEFAPDTFQASRPGLEDAGVAAAALEEALMRNAPGSHAPGLSAVQGVYDDELTNDEEDENIDNGERTRQAS